METWRAVPGFEGQYEVSDLGQVRSLPRPGTPGGILHPWRNNKGYLCVSLGRGNKRTVHSLVLEAFEGPRPPGMEALHGPGGQDDNSRRNLSWGTKARNMCLDMLRDGTFGKRLTAAEAAALRMRADAGEDLTPLAASYGVSYQTAWHISRRKTWKNL